MSLFDFAQTRKFAAKTLALGSFVMAMFGTATAAKADTLPVQRTHAKTVAFNMAEFAKSIPDSTTRHIPQGDSLECAETPVLVTAPLVEAAPAELVTTTAALKVASKGYTHKTYGSENVTKKLQKHLRQREGVKSFIYPDCRGLPTIGVGHYLSNVADATSRPFYLQDAKTGKPTNRPASKKQIADAYAAVAGMGTGHEADDAKGKTGIYLKSAYVDKMLDKDVRYVTKVVKRNMPYYDKMPEPAKEAVLTMAFAVGPNRLKPHYYVRNEQGKVVDKGFKNLTKALAEGDPAKAARYSHLNGVSEHANKMTRDLFLEAAEILRQDRLEVAQAKQAEMQAAARAMNGFSTPTATFGPQAYYLQLTDLRQ